MGRFFWVRSCVLITLIKCLKGHKSKGLIFNFEIKRLVTQSVNYGGVCGQLKRERYLLQQNWLLPISSLCHPIFCPADFWSAIRLTSAPIIPSCNTCSLSHPIPSLNHHIYKGFSFIQHIMYYTFLSSHLPASHVSSFNRYITYHALCHTSQRQPFIPSDTNRRRKSPRRKLKKSQSLEDA